MLILPPTFVAYLRGIETFLKELEVFPRLCLFVAYLRGIETKPHQPLNELVSQFVAYLRGIETKPHQPLNELVSQFVAYLRGIETLTKFWIDAPFSLCL